MSGRCRGWCTAASRRNGADGRRRTGSGSPARLPGEILRRLTQDLALFLQLTDVDHRSDLYATGCLLYELLALRPPFTGETPLSVVYQHLRRAAFSASSGVGRFRRHLRPASPGPVCPGRPYPVAQSLRIDSQIGGDLPDRRAPGRDWYSATASALNSGG
ncbi:hypothetical protein C1J00_19805 [Streptomyces cahuitamycinicus]|uniref:Protein kinase domain-containing protein n=1 Tax=Streptomyces cahuitamycinicus TaxID=2070367 RepID=A0A2N8TNC7_9ACTN|nr:hypothetical protein C1J00_19805 [Streptomyces cahuitamycinicus]